MTNPISPKVLFLGVLLGNLLCFPESRLRAQPQASEQPIKIHVMTMGPGETLFERFGHIALLVEDLRQSTQKVYNYGMFDFDTSDLSTNYARGYVRYWLGVASLPGTLRIYQARDRDVRLQTLDLSPTQTQTAVALLEENAQPQNREYDYQHYTDNCSTRIRDILDRITDGALRKDRDFNTRETYRSWTRRSLTGMPLWNEFLMFILGPAIDKPITRWDEHFLPYELSKDLDQIRMGPDLRPLVRNSQILYKRVGPTIGTDTPFYEVLVLISVPFITLLFLLPSLLLKSKKWPNRLLGTGLLLWSLLTGIGGLILTVFWTVSAHSDTFCNQNLLLCPPTNLLLLAPALKLLLLGRLGRFGQRFLSRYLFLLLVLAGIDLLLKVVPFTQSNLEFSLFFGSALGLITWACIRAKWATFPWQMKKS